MPVPIPDALRIDAFECLIAVAQALETHQIEIEKVESRRRIATRRFESVARQARLIDEIGKIEFSRKGLTASTSLMKDLKARLKELDETLAEIRSVEPAVAADIARLSEPVELPFGAVVQRILGHYGSRLQMSRRDHESGAEAEAINMNALNRLARFNQESAGKVGMEQIATVLIPVLERFLKGEPNLWPEPPATSSPE